MTFTFVKTGAIAAALLLATAAPTLAATWAMVDHNAKVRAHHNLASPPVNWIEEGDSVKIIGSYGNWYKVQLAGPDGWVKKNALTIGFVPADYDEEPNVKACFNGPYGYVCVNS